MHGRDDVAEDADACARYQFQWTESQRREEGSGARAAQRGPNCHLLEITRFALDLDPKFVRWVDGKHRLGLVISESTFATMHYNKH